MKLFAYDQSCTSATAKINTSKLSKMLPDVVSERKDYIRAYSQYQLIIDEGTIFTLANGSIFQLESNIIFNPWDKFYLNSFVSSSHADYTSHSGSNAPSSIKNNTAFYIYLCDNVTLGSESLNSDPIIVVDDCYSIPYQSQKYTLKYAYLEAEETLHGQSTNRRIPACMKSWKGSYQIAA